LSGNPLTAKDTKVCAKFAKEELTQRNTEKHRVTQRPSLEPYAVTPLRPSNIF